MRKLRGIILVLVAVLSLMVVGVAGAQTEDPTAEATDEPTCEPVSEAGAVEGTVIGVDEEENTVDVETDGGCVTVPLGGDYDHPIVELLGNYFGGADAGDYGDALDTLDTEDGVITDITEGAEEGTWDVTYEDGTTGTIDDPEEAAAIEDALDLLENGSFDVEEGEDGELSTPSVGDDIEAYHEDGIGFGALVKIYAIAEESAAACEAQEEEGEEEGGNTSGEDAEAEEDEGDEVDDCAVTVEQLVEDFQNGMSMGEMFRLYGKPSLLGVGHVRRAAGEDGGDGGFVYNGDGGAPTGDGGGDDGGDGNKGVCNARDHGGNANANGQDVNCP